MTIDRSMTIDTAFVGRCIRTLEAALSALQDVDRDEIAYDVYRAACVKEFEIVLEQSGRLVRKWLRPYFADARQVDRLHFKDVFRHAAKHGLVSVERSERWLTYRDHRNYTAHEYGEVLADEAIQLLSEFVDDAKHLATSLQASARSAQASARSAHEE